MKRLAFALAAAVLGTACGSTTPPPCNPSATIDWGSGAAGTGLRDPDGNPIDCQTAGATWVDVFVNGGFVGTFNCGDGAGTVPLVRGANDVVVEAGRAQSDILFRDRFTTTAANCGPQGAVSSRPGQGWLAVNYSFQGGVDCYSPGPTYMHLAVRDDLAFPDGGFSDTGFGTFEQCSITAAAPRYPVAIGDYTFLGINEVAGNGAILAAGCADLPFIIGRAATTTVTPVLSTTSSTACF
jgi:hypothetical protein